MRTVFGKKGFTLLEVMIALAFLGIALVAVIRTQGQGITLAEEARFEARAIFLDRMLLAEAQTLNRVSPGEEDGRFTDLDSEIRWLREISPVPGVPGLWKVQVWVQKEELPLRQGLSMQGFVYKGGS